MISPPADGNISLLVFTCEGREHLLHRTLKSFKEQCSLDPVKTTLAIDGQYSFDEVGQMQPDLIIQNYERKGYLPSIINALKTIDTEFFFWLEDDWRFIVDVDIAELKLLLANNPSWAQIRLNKRSANVQTDSNGIFEPRSLFSANPCLCRTDTIRSGFEALQCATGSQETGFEEFISAWIGENGFESRALAPGGKAAVAHTGYLESTERKWHMTSSLGDTATYIPRGGQSKPAPLWRRFYMVGKLARAFVGVASRQLWSREAYDLAFRISNVDEDRL